MRELKFRAWDKKSKQFVDDFIIDRLGNEYQTNKCEFWGDDRDIVLIQYTGLKDKNGKEIYEGDVIKNYQADINIVNFSYGCFGFQNYHAGHIPLHIQGINEKSEIIGNIYENPELGEEII